jgi:ionotropic glutamate receptor
MVLIPNRLMNLHQIGLIDFWDTWFRPMPPQCTGDLQSGNRKSGNKNSSLSLKNLTGPFLVFAVGLSLSLVAFILEQSLSIPERKLRRCNKLQLE